MPITPTQSIVRKAFRDRYAVPAINVVNDLTLEAVLAAADELRSPMIVQTSVKTVTSIGLDVIFAMWREMARGIGVPIALHLDHCPDRALISACLAKGWNSVLFDGSKLSVADNTRQTIEVVAEASAHDALVEGEIEGFKRVEELGDAAPPEPQTLETAVKFVKTTGVDVFAPAIGNAHGMYRAAPTLDSQRVSDIVSATGVPVALHGGTGLTPEQFSDLIGRGCAKVNVSTALKISFMQSGQDFTAQHPGAYDPPSLFAHQRAAVMEMVRGYIRLFGSEGKA
ncbi:MAG: class II fructose-bisphosphate aldolase [Candidatus Limnocylindrales bacterium]